MCAEIPEIYIIFLLGVGVINTLRRETIDNLSHTHHRAVVSCALAFVESLKKTPYACHPRVSLD